MTQIQPNETIQYMGYTLKPRRDGDKWEGMWVVKDYTNVAPGAAWARTVEQGKKMIAGIILAERIDAVRALATPDEVNTFWLLMELIRGEENPPNPYPYDITCLVNLHNGITVGGTLLSSGYTHRVRLLSKEGERVLLHFEEEDRQIWVGVWNCDFITAAPVGSRHLSVEEIIGRA